MEMVGAALWDWEKVAVIVRLPAGTLPVSEALYARVAVVVAAFTVKPFDNVPGSVPTLVTVTLYVPGSILAGTVHVSVVVGVDSLRVTPVQEVVPIFTVRPDRKFVPTTVTDCVALFVMLEGVMLVTVGTGLLTVKALEYVTYCESGLVTLRS